MHAFLEGVLKYLLRIVIDQLTEDKKAQIDFLIRHIFGGHRSSEMNASTFLKSNFTHGFTNLTMLTADEWAGMTFTLLVVIRSRSGQDIFQNQNTEQAITPDERPIVDLSPILPIDLAVAGENNGVLSDNSSVGEIESDFNEQDTGRGDIVILPLWELCEILERLLVFHAFYKRGAPYDWIDPAAQESKIRLMGRQMMDMIVRGLPRADGNGWKIQKLHELLHMASDMSQFGCPQNYDAGPGESSLKTWAKFPARTALKQGAVIFSDSVARRLHESACFSRMERTESSYSHYAQALTQQKKDDEKDQLHDSESDQSESDTVATPNIKSELIGRPKFLVYLTDDTPQLVQAKWLGKQKQKRLVELHPLVLKWIRAESILDPDHPERKIEGFTEYVRNGVRFRAHPNYRSAGPWHDFVMVAFSEDGTITDPVVASNAKPPPCFDPYAPPFGEQYYPCKILAFLSIPDKLDRSKPNRVAAVVQSCETRSLMDIAADTRLLQVWTLEYNKKVNGVAGTSNVNSVLGYREPTIREVDVNSFDKRVLVIEENPGLYEHLKCKQNSNATICSRRAFLVKDRDNSWAEHYLHWNSDITRQYKHVGQKAKRRNISQNNRR
jgi:hypothetical protein